MNQFHAAGNSPLMRGTNAMHPAIVHSDSLPQEEDCHAEQETQNSGGR